MSTKKLFELECAFNGFPRIAKYENPICKRFICFDFRSTLSVGHLLHFGTRSWVHPFHIFLDFAYVYRSNNMCGCAYLLNKYVGVPIAYQQEKPKKIRNILL